MDKEFRQLPVNPARFWRESDRFLYLSEFSFFDGIKDITLNIVDVCTVKNEIAIAVTDSGKISVRQFDLKKSNDGRFFFEYGNMCEQIAVDDFQQIED